ncbi:MAG TPA: hypothetical protein VLR93_11600, partial [Patescibacteria group bacterium]|nr:hypothetical protein [Patescibacteria group bacterium]
MTGPELGAPALDPCAEERRIADERCALADRLGEAAQAAADRTKEAQRQYDEHVGRSERAAAVADPRAVRTAKEAAWTDFRSGNTRALSREAVEAAARDWLQEIDRIGRTAQEAEQEVARERDAAAALVPELERLAHEAEIAQRNAESASSACAAARDVLTACEVAERDRIAGKARAAAEEAESTAARPRLYGGVDLEPAPRTLEEEAPDRLLGDHEPAILKLLRGDRDAMDRTVTVLAGAVAADRRHWQLMVSGLIDAILARAIEASALEFPADQPFWALFSEEQARDIATALASFGYRFDGMGGFLDGRIPSQRDLSLAVGYAGFDPMRIRRWPTEAETADLYRGVAVAAGDYL